MLSQLPGNPVEAWGTSCTANSRGLVGVAKEDFKIHDSYSSFSVQDMNRVPWSVSISSVMPTEEMT